MQKQFQSDLTRQHVTIKDAKGDPSIDLDGETQSERSNKQKEPGCVISEDSSASMSIEFKRNSDGPQTVPAILVKRFGIGTISTTLLIGCFALLQPPKFLKAIGFVSAPEPYRFAICAAIIFASLILFLLALQYVISKAKRLVSSKDSQKLGNQILVQTRSGNAIGSSTVVSENKRGLKAKRVDFFEIATRGIEFAYGCLFRLLWILMMSCLMLSAIWSMFSGFDLVNVVKAMPIVFERGISLDDAKLELARSAGPSVAAARAREQEHHGHYDMAEKLYSIAAREYVEQKIHTLESAQVLFEYAELLKSRRKEEESKLWSTLGEKWQKKIIDDEPVR